MKNTSLLLWLALATLNHLPWAALPQKVQTAAAELQLNGQGIR